MGRRLRLLLRPLHLLPLRRSMQTLHSLHCRLPQAVPLLQLHLRS